MNKKVLISVVVLLLLGAGAYFFFTKSKTGTSVVNTATQVASGAKSLKELIAAGVPQECTYSSSDESGSMSGTSYISGGSVRTDFSSTASGKTSTSHMITDGKIIYTWTDGEANGFKMTVPEETKAGDTTTQSTETQSAANMDQKVDYKCSAWVPDNSKFTPPANVKFTDFSQMLGPSAAPTGGSGSSSQCSVCNSLTGDDKASCLSALNCK